MMALPKSQKGLVFTCSIEHAEQLALILSYLMKQTIFAYHSKTPNRDDVLRSFIETKANGIIVAVGALDEGFDCTSVNRILDLEVYKERTRRLIQRLGRFKRYTFGSTGCFYKNIIVFRSKTAWPTIWKSNWQWGI